MPELPEVECARKLVESNCNESIIVDVITVEQGGGPRSNIFDDKVYECSSTDAGSAEGLFRDLLLGAKLTSVERKGKQLWFQLEGREFVLFHFGMTGAFVVKDVTAHTYRSFKVDADVGLRNLQSRSYCFRMELDWHSLIRVDLEESAFVKSRFLSHLSPISLWTL